MVVSAESNRAKTNLFLTTTFILVFVCLHFAKYFLPQAKMGKAYDGKKRWNETILATTVRVSAASARHNAAKKRLSGTTPLLSSLFRASSVH